MVVPFRKPYCVPDVLPDGKGPLARQKNPVELLNPKDPSRGIFARDYSWHTIVKSRTKVNDKRTPTPEINRLIQLAEKTIDKSCLCFEQVALISGFPVLLRTNSPHLYNFWSRNWYLGYNSEVVTRGVEAIVLHAAIGVE